MPGVDNTKKELHGQQRQKWIEFVRETDEWQTVKEALTDEYGAEFGAIEVLKKTIVEGTDHYSVITVIRRVETTIDGGRADLSMGIDPETDDVLACDGWIDVFDEDGLLEEVHVVRYEDGEAEIYESDVELPEDLLVE